MRLHEVHEDTRVFFPTRRPSIFAILALPKDQAVYLRVSFQSLLEFSDE